MRNIAPRRLVLLSILAAWSQAALASAAAVQYEWAPMIGSGTYSVLGGPTVPYFSNDGHMIIYYDPDNPANDSITAFVGDPVNQPIEVGALLNGGTIAITLAGDTLQFVGASELSNVNVRLTGDPGPLTPNGLPENLDGFLDQQAIVMGVSGSEIGNNVLFQGLAGTPEPSSLILLVMAMPAAVYVLRRRRLACR